MRVLFVSESYGAVRYAFHFFKLIRCGALRFISFTVRCGIEYNFEESDGAVLCGAV